MIRWQTVWHQGIAPLLTDEELRLLEAALERDDPRLIQGADTDPPCCEFSEQLPCEGACLLAFVSWQTEPKLRTVAEVRENFDRLALDVSERLRGKAGYFSLSHFLNWFDDTPRATMRVLLLAEIHETIRRRRVPEVCDA